MRKAVADFVETNRPNPRICSKVSTQAFLIAGESSTGNSSWWSVESIFHFLVLVVVYGVFHLLTVLVEVVAEQFTRRFYASQALTASPGKYNSELNGTKTSQNDDQPMDCLANCNSKENAPVIPK